MIHMVVFFSCTVRHCLANFPNSFWTSLCLNIVFIGALLVELLFKATDGILYPPVLRRESGHRSKGFML